MTWLVGFYSFILFRPSSRDVRREEEKKKRVAVLFSIVFIYLFLPFSFNKTICFWGASPPFCENFLRVEGVLDSKNNYRFRFTLNIIFVFLDFIAFIISSFLQEPHPVQRWTFWYETRSDRWVRSNSPQNSPFLLLCLLLFQSNPIDRLWVLGP